MKIKEDQLRIRLELQKQMEQHKIAKAEEKKGDLEYFEYIRSKKEEQEREQNDKKDSLKKMLEEQKLVRDRQIDEHNRLKYQAEKEKKRDAEKLKSMFQDLQDEKTNKKVAEREKKERTLASYKEQIQLRTQIDEQEKQLKRAPQMPNDMLTSIFS